MTKKPIIYEPCFNPIGHLYHTPQGLPLDSVTTIIKLELNLYQWGNMAAAERGTNVHKITEDIDRGTFERGAVISEVCRPYVDAYRLAKKELGFKIQDTERRLYHPDYLFAGTIDRDVLHLGDEWVIDLKTGAVEKWHVLQTAAYAALYQCSFPRKKPRRRGCLYLRPDGTYKLEEHSSEKDWQYFLALYSAHNTKIALGYRKIKGEENYDE